MSHELMMLSVSKGLRPDSSGFCTVARSRGIPRNLEAAMEHPPRYRHLFPPESPDAPLNAVACAHRIVTFEDARWHVLSCTSDAGIDFHQRSNRLVHQLAFSPEETTVEGPAWILSQPGVFFKSWVGPSLEFPRGRPAPTRYGSAYARETALEERDLPPVVGSSRCPLWEQSLGDAGWAGMLAETVYTARETVIVHSKGVDLLPLILEAVALLPIEDRWKATFSTFYVPDSKPGENGLPDQSQSESILWKGVVRSTPEEQTLARRRGILLIDLTRPPGPAPEGVFADFARGGPAPGAGAAIFQNIGEIQAVPVPPPLPGRPASQPPGGESLSGTASEEAEEAGSRKTPGSLFADISEETAPDAFSKTVEGKDNEFFTEISPEAPVPPVAVPPVIVPTSIGLRSARKGKGAIDSLLAVRSRHFFYLAYAAAFGVVLLLIFLLFDQQLKWGWAAAVKRTITGRSAGSTEVSPPSGGKKKPGTTSPKPANIAKPIPRNVTPTVTRAPAKTPNVAGVPNGDKTEPADTPRKAATGDLATESNERPGQSDSPPESPPAAPGRSGLLDMVREKEKEEEQRQVWLEKRQLLRAEQGPLLERILNEWTPPPSISLPIPTISDEPQPRIVKPDPLLVKDFAPLWQAGAALSLEYVPYFKGGVFQPFCRECDPIERRRILAVGQDVTPESNVAPDANEPYCWLIGVHTGENGEDEAKKAEAGDRENVENEETEEILEVPLCLLSLDAQGLTFDWLPEALESQYFQDAGRIPFALLIPRVLSPSPEDELAEPVSAPAETRRHLIPLFSPEPLPPISVASVLNGTDVDLPVLFANLPWSDVFEGNTPWDRVSLAVETDPQAVKGFREARIRTDDENPLRMRVNLHSDRFYNQDRTDTTATPLSVAVSGGRFFVRNDYKAEITRLTDEIKKYDDDEKDWKTKLENMQKKQLTGRPDAKTREELEALRAKVNEETGCINESRRNVRTERENLPKVLKDIAGIESLRLRVALRLAPPAPDLPPITLMSTQP